MNKKISEELEQLSQNLRNGLDQLEDYLEGTGVDDELYDDFQTSKEDLLITLDDIEENYAK